MDRYTPEQQKLNEKLHEEETKWQIEKRVANMRLSDLNKIKDPSESVKERLAKETERKVRAEKELARLSKILYPK